jgi:hypothetical protein
MDMVRNRGSKMSSYNIHTTLRLWQHLTPLNISIVDDFADSIATKVDALQVPSTTSE